MCPPIPIYVAAGKRFISFHVSKNHMLSSLRDIISKMGESALPPSSKMKKVFEGQDARQERDVISTLSDDILIHILSFLPTNAAIRTSLLSKRWKCLWLFVPSFCFHDPTACMSHDQIQKFGPSFLDSVERALLFRDASCLVKLCLWLDMHVSASRVNSWLSAAIKHNVQNLHLVLYMDEELVLPDSLFCSRSLSSFWLKMNCALKLPSFICFSSLKELNLNGVTFEDDQSIQQLFSGFPVLEDLTLENCNWENITEVTIEIPTLRSLTFTEKGFYHIDFLDCKIIFSALNLETLNLYGYLKVELLACDLLSLNEASININNVFCGHLEHSQRLLRLLCCLHNVKSLGLSDEAVESLFFIEGDLPSFYNLTMLNASVNGPYVEEDYTSGALMYILVKSPNLESLILPRGFKAEDYMRNVFFSTNIVPDCLRTCLKSVQILNVGGYEVDLFFLKYFYENASVLERLDIFCGTGLSKDLEKQEKIFQQLQELRGGSGRCTILFHPYVFP